MNNQIKALNTYFWNALYDLRERIAQMQKSHLDETIQQSSKQNTE